MVTAEVADAEICVKIGYRQNCPVAVLRLVGNSVYQHCGGNLIFEPLRQHRLDALLLICGEGKGLVPERVLFKRVSDDVVKLQHPVPPCAGREERD